MNKKLKKILATVSAVAMCATSVVSMSAGAMAVFKDKVVRPETTSFSASIYGKDVKFHLWQKATDYFDDEDKKIYISDTLVNGSGKEYTYKLISTHKVYRNTPDGPLHDYCSVGLFDGNFFEFDNSEDFINFKKYLLDNHISYKTMENIISINYVSNDMDDEYFDILQKIKDDTGVKANWVCPSASIQITETENTLPEPTLTGDANEDGNVNMSDAVLIMQTLSNPDEYKLTPQGIANADMDGDGVTAMDALTIQLSILNQ